MENGELLRKAEEDGYEILVTTDQNIRFQQNLSDRNLAIIVLLSPAWPHVRLRTEEIRAAVAKVGNYNFMLTSRRIPLYYTYWF